MTALPLVITAAGLARFTAAQVDEDIDLGITSVGLTDQPFVVAPTLTALPGQFRTVETLSGKAVGPNIVHMIVRDPAELSYTVRGFGLFLEDGTLFAVYGQEEPLFEKSAATTMLLAVDMAFPTEDIDSITFGDTNFLNPPATTETAGVVELATEEEAIAGADVQRAVTPAALQAAIAAALAAAADPIGTMKLWWGAAEDVEAGWALCHGQTVARSDGAGDITLPDMRDRVPVGVSGTLALGDVFGALTATAATEEAGAHVHPAGDLAATIAEQSVTATLNFTTKGDTASGGSGKTISVPPDPGAATPTISVENHAHGASLAGDTASAGAHAHDVTISTAQPSLALHFIMRI